MFKYIRSVNVFWRQIQYTDRSFYSTNANQNKIITVGNKHYERDCWTNVTDSILKKIGRGLHCDKYHPLGILMARIKHYFYQNYRKATGTPIYSVYDNFSPVVTVQQNFDDLLIPSDHVSRSPSDTYYINEAMLLRSHTSAHEDELIRSGLDAFLIVGDVYRRDEIDTTHYPVFHQLEGVRLFSRHELFRHLSNDSRDKKDFLIESQLPGISRTTNKQERHGDLAAMLIQHELKTTLEKLATFLFGKDINYRWVPAYFPWTHPSFELEIQLIPGIGEWVEFLGCGVIEQAMLDRCGATEKIGMAFGLGLERWAMKLFNIEDIRLFWSQDPGFRHQFVTDDIHSPIKYKPISVYPPCSCDVSFWLPVVTGSGQPFHSNDFYELVHSIAGDIVERVELVDQYEELSAKGTHEEQPRTSHCYRIVYRDMTRTLTKSEVNAIHQKIMNALPLHLGCVMASPTASLFIPESRLYPFECI